MGDVATAPAGSTLDLAAIAFRGSVALADAEGVNVADVIAAYERRLGLTLADRDPMFNGDATAKVRTALKLIGMKIDPRMDEEQAMTWLTAVAMALSDFPWWVITAAVPAAIRVPMRFLNEVDGVVREKAEDVMRRHRVALYRLRALEREIANAAKPKLEAPEGWDGGDRPPPTKEELRKMARSELGITVLRLGLGNGHIAQEDFDAAISLRKEEKIDE